MAELCNQQMEKNRRSQHPHGHFYFENEMPHFNVSSNVKLPPITNDIPLFAKASIARTINNKTAAPRTEMNLHLPQVYSPSSVCKAKAGLVLNEQFTVQAAKRRTSEKIKHVESIPLDFPKVYTVLPPINSSKHKAVSADSYGKQQTPLQGKQTITPGPGRPNITTVIDREACKIQYQKQNSHQNRKHSDSFKGSSSKRNHKNRQDKNSKGQNRNNLKKDIVSGTQGEIVFSAEKNRKDIPEDVTHSKDTLGFTLEKVKWEDAGFHVIEDARSTLQQLEISEELQEFLDCNLSKRRGGACTELESNLGIAADYIRDILLRQTMEELCMMW